MPSPPRKPMGIARTAVPQVRRDAGRAVDVHGAIIVDEHSADAVRTKKKA